MSGRQRLEDMDRQERIALCRQVMESLSDLVEGTAPADFCERVERIMGGCQPYVAFRATLEATLRLLRECGTAGQEFSPDVEACYRRGVVRAREAMARRQGGDKS